MHETEIQTRMTEKILSGELDKITIYITENEKAIVIQSEEEEIDAAYTAEEARELADAMENDTEDWDMPPYPALTYLREIAKVLDNEKEVEDIGGVEHNEMFLENYE